MIYYNTSSGTVATVNKYISITMLSAVLRSVKLPFSVTSNAMRIQMKTIKPELPATPTMIANLLSTTESKIRNQMINPAKNVIDKEEAELLSLINGFRLEAEGYSAEMKERPPVVTIMGHVDHGKTTLLDYLRKSEITKHEYGGITQKIGAFNVEYKNEKVTVIDTPGHQAFVNMRMRGATVTDMIILVVSATEGVKRQTLEVIDIAKKSHIPLIIAINKIDLPEADTRTVEEELTQNGVSIEPAEGTVPVVHISAKNGLNVDLLIELVLEQWREMDVKADYGSQLEGAVIEAHPGENAESSATVLLQKGALSVGDWLVVGTHYFKVKIIKDDQGNKLTKAFPGQAVEVFGFKQIPTSGELVFRVETEGKAKFITDRRMKKQEEETSRNIMAPSSSKIKITTRREKRALYSGFGNLWIDKFKEVEEKLIQENEQYEKLIKEKKAAPQTIKKYEQNKLELQSIKQYTYQYLGDTIKKQNTLNIIIKTSDRGCEQTVLKEFGKIKTEIQSRYNLNINLLRSEVGEVNQSDIREAHLFNAEIFCFGITSRPEAFKAMKQYGLKTHNHKLLHNLLEDIKNMCLNKSKQASGSKDKGSATIADVFKVTLSKKESKTAAGIRITEGRLCKKHLFKIIRNGEQVKDGLKIQSMKHFKKEVTELKKGEECTIIFETEAPFQKGDTLKAYQ